MTEYVPSRAARRTSEDRLVRRIKSIEDRLSKSVRTPQLPNSAIDDGAITVTQDGAQVGIIGQQYDGTNGYITIAGPNPPVPAAPAITATPGGVIVKVSGAFADPQTGFSSPVVAPLDFVGWSVEVDSSTSFTAPRTYGLTSAAGGHVTVAWPTTATPLYARVRSRTAAGKISNPSVTAGPVSSGAVGLGDLGFNLADYAASNTIVYSTTQPSPDPSRIGTLWVKQVAAGPPPRYETWRWTGAAWQLLQDQGVTTALANAAAAQTAADTKAKLFTQSTTPAYTGAANTAYWINTSAGGSNLPEVWNGTAWVPYRLGNGAIQPNSLVASNVIATGTVSAALLEALLVLTTSVIAGNAAGDHAQMSPTGFRVYTQDPVDNIPNEVVRMGTDTNDYFGVVDSAGDLVASVNDVGGASFTDLFVKNDPLIMGTKFSTWVGNASGAGNGLSSGALQGAQNYYGFVSQTGGGITSEVGLIEVGAYVDASRQYLIIPEIPVQASSTDGVCNIAVRDKQGTGNFTGLTDAVVYFRSVPTPTLRVMTAGFPALYRPNVTGNTRLLLTVASGGTGTLSVPNNALAGTAPVLTLIDLGPAKPINATQNNITAPGTGGSVVQPRQQYYVELAPSGYASFKGSGVIRTDTTDVVQGWDPSGTNGDGFGDWSFSLPSITGTVDRVDLYLYTNHTYYNSGGTGILNILKGGAVSSAATFNALKMRIDWLVGGYPKPGGKTVTLPSDWWPFFANAAGANRVSAIGVGPDGGSDNIYYCRFAGPDARLRIWFTQ